MPFDSEKFLEIAKNILEDRKYQHEGGFRTSISRAYYSAFLFAKKKLEETGSSFNYSCRMCGSTQIHKQVIDELKEKNSFVGDQLDNLKEYRVMADYETYEEINLLIANKCAKFSEIIINEIRKMNLKS